jgi:hypothetical protein
VRSISSASPKSIDSSTSSVKRFGSSSFTIACFIRERIAATRLALPPPGEEANSEGMPVTERREAA